MQEITLTLLKGKLHRATVTQADLHYEGSITIDQNLLDAAGILLYEQVDVLDIDNGNRLTTYTIPGERGSGIIGINGAAARLISPGDKVIIIAYAQMPASLAKSHQPTVVLLDDNNNINIAWVVTQIADKSHRHDRKSRLDSPDCAKACPINLIAMI